MKSTKVINLIESATYIKCAADSKLFQINIDNLNLPI